MASLTLKAGAKALEKTAKVKIRRTRQLGGVPVEHCKFNADHFVVPSRSYPAVQRCGTSW